MESVEGVLDSLGLMRGDFAIVSRIVFGTLVTGFLLTYTEPSVFFDADGKSLGFEDGTVPWWAVSVAVGAILGLFI